MKAFYNNCKKDKKNWNLNNKSLFNKIKIIHIKCKIKSKWLNNLDHKKHKKTYNISHLINKY